MELQGWHLWEEMCGLHWTQWIRIVTWAYLHSFLFAVRQKSFSECKSNLRMKARQAEFHSPYSTVFRPEFAHLDTNEDFTNDFEVTVCSLLCAIGLNIPLSYSLGRTDVWNQQVLCINWTFLNYLYTQGEIQQLKHWYQTENWGTDYLMCCLEVEVWLFLKRKLKILLKCTESELNADIKVCLCVYRQS